MLVVCPNNRTCFGCPVAYNVIDVDFIRHNVIRRCRVLLDTRGASRATATLVGRTGASTPEIFWRVTLCPVGCMHKRQMLNAFSKNPQTGRGEAMATREKWYALQVTSGKEQATINALERVLALYADAPGFEGVQAPAELFSPRYLTARAEGGEYIPVQKPLLPGYVIAITADAEGLNRMCRKVHSFARLLGNEEAFIPLSTTESDWLARFTGKGNRVVLESTGFKEGGRVVVTSGPLVGYEAQITRINRRKHEAYVSLSMLGRQVQVKVGFHLMRKSD